MKFDGDGGGGGGGAVKMVAWVGDVVNACSEALRSFITDGAGVAAVRLPQSHLLTHSLTQSIRYGLCSIQLQAREWRGDVATVLGGAVVDVSVPEGRMLVLAQPPANALKNSRASNLSGRW